MAKSGAGVSKGREPLVVVEGLRKYFPVRRGFWQSLRGGAAALKAVDGVTLTIPRGASLGIAGESGCGKTTTGKLLLRLMEPTAGRILFDGQDVTHIRGPHLKAFRKKAQLMFQNPYEALNPRFTILRSLAEPMLIHGIDDAEEREARAIRALEEVNLRPVANYLDVHPHHLSGGQLQRVVLARALVLDPIFLVADEPVSMLDVSIRAGVLNLMRDLSARLGLTTVYISHDLSLIRYMCEYTAVMYLGRVVEYGRTEQVIENPRHPYTQALLGAVPVPDPDAGLAELLIKDHVPSPIDLPAGCRFAGRCPAEMEHCKSVPPPLVQTESGHAVECHLFTP